MTDEPETNDALDEWKESMQAEHQDAIENPNPDESHCIESVAQVNYRLTFGYDAAADELERIDTEQVDEATDPELFSCSCGVRGMRREEARTHIRAAERLDEA